MQHLDKRITAVLEKILAIIFKILARILKIMARIYYHERHNGRQSPHYTVTFYALFFFIS